ncbi:structural maintenance of chromosomes protein 1 [Tanacetum coccineum]
MSRHQACLAQSWPVIAQSCLLNNYTFDPVLDKAILFADGNTLVCDDLDEAKHLSWTGERSKVATVDGILLTKAGTMTGGLNKKKEGFEAELQQLGSIREMRIKESEACGKISYLEKKIQFAEIEKVIEHHQN